MRSTFPKNYLNKIHIYAFVTLFFLAASLSWTDITSAATKAEIVNDVTTLNPVLVRGVVVPKTLAEIQESVKNASGPVSIGGGRFSMGGQTATAGAVQLDMRAFNQILAFDRDAKEITVEAGATWRQIQEYIDLYDLSIKIMQSYSDFTVGGSLSVNVHGRYIGYGPLVMSVKRIGVVLADGSYIDASPTQNTDIFYSAIGGYGGIGVITDATLELTNNVKVRRIDKVMPLSEYKNFFFREVRDNPKAIFHNADIYPNAYDTVRAATYEETDLPLTEENRLVLKDRSYGLDRTLLRIISGAPGGKGFRRYIVDPIRYFSERVLWRNYEASYSVLELEPSSRQESTYVLQEYFVPVDHLENFVAKMAKILNTYDVNMINISIRHANPDPGTILAWAQQEVFAFVLYYKQGTTTTDKEYVGIWTRALIDAAIEEDGRYYLPYQIHATEAQFKTAYPGWQKFFDIKRRVDPTYKFRNKLWDAYYLGVEAETLSVVPNAVRAYLVALKAYRQNEGQCFLTMPE